MKKKKKSEREKHELYQVWRWIKRRYTVINMVDERWYDLSQFVTDVGKRPDKNYKFTRKDTSKPFSPDNWAWRKECKNDEEKRERYKLWMREWKKKRISKDPDYEFEMGIKKSFGLTREDYYKMHKEQNGVCAICKGGERSVNPKTKKIRRLAVDHCHSYGTIRGLLCSDCNRGLGLFKDSEECLAAAISYLTKAKTTIARNGVINLTIGE